MAETPAASVNLILFEPDEIARPLPRRDRRAHHLLEVLRRREGDAFDAGIVNGPRGKGTLVGITPDVVTLSFAWGEPPPSPDPIQLIVGLPRPQTARKILHEATALGIAALHFVHSERGEPSYASSTLWSSGEWRQHLVAGAEQAFCTLLPSVATHRALTDSLAAIPVDAIRIGLDNYEAPRPLASVLAKHASAQTPHQSVVLAIGSERGWSPAERTLLRAHHFDFVHLGPRVLRTETACVAAIAIVKSALGWF